MKNVARELICLDALVMGQSNAINSSFASNLGWNGSVNSLKVDYQPSAVTILAEIGDFGDFEKPERLSAWCGLVPSVYQSADKLITGSITKHGSRHLRWILVEVAQVVA